MKTFILLAFTVTAVMSEVNGQVALSTKPTISFSHDNDFAGNIITPGQGGSVAISDLSLQIRPINNLGALLTADPVEYHGGDPGWLDYPPIITYGNSNTIYAWSIRSGNGDNFSLLSLDFNDWGSVEGDAFKIEAYEGGLLRGSFTFTGNTDFRDYVSLTQASGDPSVQLPAIFTNVDEVRILMANGFSSWIGINNIRVATPGITLPLNLLSFVGTQAEGSFRLNWKTSEETGFSHFEIERSNDGVVFAKVAIVPGSQMSGDQYSYIDIPPFSSAWYYRIRMVDYDGNHRYSRTILLRSESLAKVSLFPNPVTGSLQVSLPKLPAGKAELRIINIKGQQLTSTTLETNGNAMSVSLDAAELPAGRYFLQVIAAGEKYTLNFIKQ